MIHRYFVNNPVYISQYTVYTTFYYTSVRQQILACCKPSLGHFLKTEVKRTDDGL
jgi:hypothetical protein